MAQPHENDNFDLGCNLVHLVLGLWGIYAGYYRVVPGPARHVEGAFRPIPRCVSTARAVPQNWYQSFASLVL